MTQFDYQYRNISQTRQLIEMAFKLFVKSYRLKRIKSTSFQGMDFLNELQSFIIELYRNTKMGKSFLMVILLLFNLGIVLMRFRICTHS
jgi:hypothetical protein